MAKVNPKLVKNCLSDPKPENSGAAKEEKSMLGSSGSLEHNIILLVLSWLISVKYLSLSWL